MKISKHTFTILFKHLKSSEYKKVSIYTPWEDTWNNTVQIKNNRINIPPFPRSTGIISE